jgi:hypothetical protein
MARQFQFVVVSNPTEAPSPESKKLAYSHAFRQAHAQRRREQTERYRKEIASVLVKKVSTASEETVSSPLSQVLNSNRDLFSSLARPLSPVEYFLLNHCMSIITVFLLPKYLSMGGDSPQDRQPSRPLSDIALVTDVHVVVPFTIGHCGLFDYPGDHKTQLLREWVGLAITDNALMIAAILLSTCRYILQVQPGNLVFVQLALQYKQICLQTLRQEMSATSAPVNLMTVAKALALAVDEVMSFWSSWHD